MIRRRIALIYWTVAITLFLPGAVYAYIDPATTTYLIQIATALVVTIGVSLSIFLYRFRMISSKIKYWFYGLAYRIKTKGGQNKEQKAAEKMTQRKPYELPAYAIPGADKSPELDSFDKNIREALSAGKAIGAPEKTQKEALIPQTYINRLRMAFPVALAFCYTFIVIGCLELAVIHSPEIPFKLSVIVPYVFLVFAVSFAVLLLAVPHFRGKVFEILISAGLATILAGYIQGNFLNWGIGQLTGDAVMWGELKPQIAASLICWAGCFVLVFFFYGRKRRICRSVLFFAPFLLILLQGISLISVIHENINEGVWGAGVYWKTADETLTIDRINEVAYEKNAILIILDRLDQEFVEEIAAEDPHFFDPLDGFTEFDDFIQYYGSTFPSVTGYLTGHKYMYDMSRMEYFNYAWSHAVFLQSLKERGVDVRLYLDRGFAFNSAKQLGGIASNTFEGELSINKRIAIVKLLKLSGYRYAPIPMKQLFWLAPTEFISTLELTDKTAPYMVDDFSYYENLTANGLRVSETSDSFMYLHLLGSHPPLNMDENIQYVENSTLTGQSKGAFKIVFEYLRQLKELGYYEDSLIIIMGDHGNYLGDELERPARSALMVKPSGSAGTPLSISHAPVCPDQLHATLMEGLFGDSCGFGDSFFDIAEDADYIREYAINDHRYEIKGDGRDFSNWRFIGFFSDEFE